MASVYHQHICAVWKGSGRLHVGRRTFEGVQKPQCVACWHAEPALTAFMPIARLRTHSKSGIHHLYHCG